MFSRGYEVESFFNFKFSGDADVLLMLSQDSDDEIRSKFVFELAI